MNKNLVYILIFIFGFLSAHAISQLNIEKPLSLGISIIGNPNAPQPIVKPNNIMIGSDRITIFIANSSLSRYAATGSMLPLLNENSKGIKIPVTTPDQLHIGDVITFKDSNSDDLIIHRIINIGFDEQGTFYTTKGDNNLASDGKIRYEQIMYKLVALVY